jgi:hypothetical protein
MFKNIFCAASRGLVAHNENAPDTHAQSENMVSHSNVRALATGAALAVSIDTSPAVLVSIYDYANRYRERPRRTA